MVAPTIKDIAKLAEVSHTTVSRALRGHPAISDETVARIKKIAEEVGYVPSAAARTLKTNRSFTLGVYVERVADPFFAEVLDGIQDVLQDAGYSLLLSSPGGNPDYEETTIQAMVEQRIDGLLMCTAFVSQESYDKIQASGIPIVVVHNRAIADFKYSLYHDDFYGGKMMTKHLIDLGHHRVAYVANSRHGRISKDRLMGYKAALEDAVIPFNADYVVDAGGNELEAGVAAAKQLMHLPTPPTAIFCYNDLIAVGVMQGVLKAGYRIPQDCSVVGFDNIPLAGYVQPALTTFDQPKYYLGNQAATMILKLLDEDLAEDDFPTETVVLRGKIIVRDSTERLVPK